MPAPRQAGQLAAQRHLVDPIVGDIGRQRQVDDNAHLVVAGLGACVFLTLQPLDGLLQQLRIELQADAGDGSNPGLDQD